MVVTKKNCWNCKINLGDKIILDEDFKTLNDIADKLGISYNKISELGPNGRRKNKKLNSPYLTDITLTRLEKGRIKKQPKLKLAENMETIKEKEPELQLDSPPKTPSNSPATK